MPRSTTALALFASATMALPLACNEPVRTAPPSPRDAALTAPAPPSSRDGSLGDASADAGADASRAAPSSDVPAPALPSAFAAFGPDAPKVAYRITDAVDTHDPDAKGRAESKTRATAHVSGLVYEKGEWVSTVDWEIADDETVPATLPHRFTVTQDELREGLEPGVFVFRASELVKKRPVCREERGKGPYGAQRRRICIDLRGLVSLREENCQGPRVLQLVRE